MIHSPMSRLIAHRLTHAAGAREREAAGRRGRGRARPRRRSQRVGRRRLHPIRGLAPRAHRRIPRTMGPDQQRRHHRHRRRPTRHRLPHPLARIGRGLHLPLQALDPRSAHSTHLPAPHLRAHLKEMDYAYAPLALRRPPLRQPHRRSPPPPRTPRDNRRHTCPEQLQAEDHASPRCGLDRRRMARMAGRHMAT